MQQRDIHNWVLSRDWDASGHSLSITDHHAEDLFNARELLLSALHHEQSFASVGENYYEFEESRHSLGLRHSPAQPDTMSDRWHRTYEIGRRLNNLLASCRFYLDFSKQRTGKELNLKSVIASEVEEVSKKYYDASFSYRLMEALRNYMQHRGMPIEGLVFDMGWTGPREHGGQYKKSVELSVSVDQLRDDCNFKRSVAGELEDHAKKGKLKLVSHIKSYVSDLYMLHDCARNRSVGLVDNALDLVATSIKSAARSDSQPMEYCYLIDMESPSDSSRQFLHAGWAVRLRYLRSAYEHLKLASDQVTA